MNKNERLKFIYGYIYTQTIYYVIRKSVKMNSLLQLQNKQLSKSRVDFRTCHREGVRNVRIMNIGTDKNHQENFRNGQVGISSASAVFLMGIIDLSVSSKHLSTANIFKDVQNISFSS